MAFPAVEIHAHIIDTILQGDFIERPDWTVIFDLLAIILPGIVLFLIIPRIRTLYTGAFTLALVGFYLIVNHYIFVYSGLWLTVVYPIFSTVLVSASVTTVQFITEERRRREIREAFSHYVAPSLVDELVRNPERLTLGGEEKRLTVLFSDIRGFTKIAEGLKPETLGRLMNDYLTPMTEIILQNGGTIDKYMGDAIMAFWGAPVWQEDHAVRACRTALKMLKELDELQTLLNRKGIPRLEIGIGISTGRLTVGNMGSSTRFDYTVIGDMVNLGSRLEDLNKKYGTNIIIPKYTYEDVKEEFILRQLDVVRVKGKEIPIKIYELLGEGDGDDHLREIARLFEAGLECYMAKEWEGAERYFQRVIESKPDDGPSRIFLSRIQVLREKELPPDWDGVFKMEQK